MTWNVVTVQLGQCGNQCGTQLFAQLAEEAAATRDPDARAALTEAR